MKKISAYIFLVLQLISLSGYLLFQLSIERSENSMDKKLDCNAYAAKDLMEIKIPLHLPYTYNGVYEKLKGQIEQKGIWYSYVARKVSKDTLYLLCIPNIEKTRIVSASLKDGARDEIFVFNGSQSHQSKKIKAADDYVSFSFNNNFFHLDVFQPYSFKMIVETLPNGNYKEIKTPPKFFI